MKDTELVQQVLSGNSHAFTFLVARYQKLVLHVVGRIVQRQDEVEDVCQDVFIKVYKKLRKFRFESKLSTWIARIAYNTSISYIRRSKEYTQSIDEKQFLAIPDPHQSPGDHKLERDEARKYLLDLVEKLPVHYRTVLTLYHLEEFNYREIGEITGMPEGTVKSYLSRARKLLKVKLDHVVKIEKNNIFADYA